MGLTSPLYVIIAPGSSAIGFVFLSSSESLLGYRASQRSLSLPSDCSSLRSSPGFFAGMAALRAAIPAKKPGEGSHNPGKRVLDDLCEVLFSDKEPVAMIAHSSVCDQSILTASVLFFAYIITAVPLSFA